MSGTRKMQYLASHVQRFVALLFSACCFQATFAGQPTPTAAFLEAFKSHASRVQSGDSTLDPFVHDLQPIAASGDPVAQFMLAMLISKSEPDAAISLFHKSYEGGCVGAAGAIGALVAVKSPVVARSWLVKAADAGDASSQLAVAGMHERGEGNFAKSKAVAVAWAKLGRGQAYNRGITWAADQYLARLEPTLSAAEATEAEATWSHLMRNHPKQPLYLCGQSVP